MYSSREDFVSQFFNVVGKEYQIASRRISLWIAAGLLILFYAGSEVEPFLTGGATALPLDQLWQAAALTVFRVNLFFPLLGGILAADRLSRDYHLGVNELQESTPIRRGVNLLAKYLGVVGSWLVPEMICLIVIAIVPIAGGIAPWENLGAVLLCGLAINLPSLLFVTAFSLACPMVMPVRVYQVLFTGYWFWGNFLNPEAFPTVSGTLLNASGTYAMQGFFGVKFGSADSFTSIQAVMNISILVLLVAAVLLLTNFYLTKWMKRA